MRLSFSLLLSLFIFISLGSSPAQTNLIKKPIVWDSKNKLPLLKGKSQQIGLAGALIGVSNDRLIIAGGANFPTGMPWEGGKKVLNKDIYIATLVNGTTLEWESKNIQLPEPIAYSANVNFENGFISIGGEKNQGPVNHVSYWIWDEKNGNLIENRLPNLQSPLTNSAAIIFNHHLYVIGGENLDGPTAAVWFLDLVRREKGWQRGPSLPLPTTHATAVVQADGEGTQLFLIGGRAKQSSGISELYNQVLKLGVKENQWSSKSPITLGQVPIPAISAASGIASGSANILMFGGDDGQIFHQIETLDKKIKEAESEQEKSYLTSLKKQLVENHPGFNKAVLLYNTITDTWTRLNDLPYSPVTTTALHWKGHVIIPSGEIHPGIRTPKILIGSCETTSPQPQPTSKVQMAPFSQQQQVRVTSIGNSVIYSAGIPDREDNAHISQLQPLLGENYTIKNFVRNEPSTFADLINLSGLPASTFNLKIQ
jgi:N-acetylneuraminic acid mutarotase